MSFETLKDLKHNITIAPILRFYDAAWRTLGDERVKKIEELQGAILATTAFSMLWRAAKGSTDNIDFIYREIMRLGVPKLSIPPLAKRAGESNGLVSLSSYKQALRYFLEREGISDKESWVKAASKTPIYKHTKVVARFLLFCATDNAVADEANPGLIKRGLPGISPLFKIDNWRHENYYSVEHIAPQSAANHWSSAFYDEPDLVHRLGNLILLPQEANSLIGDRPWTYKKIFYDLLSASTVEDQRQLKPN